MKDRYILRNNALCKSGLILFLLIATLGANSVWAKHIVKGTITSMAGQPATGYLVKAWDVDTGDDDLMGQAYTDSKGQYNIKYGDKWDTRVAGSTSFRPDIRVIVYAKIGGKWVQVKQSGEYKNWKMANDLTVNLKLPGIQGTIRESNGQPARGILVRAWDEDDILGGKHDFLNEAYTDSQGRYFIMYEGKHWDPAPHGNTVWRPDIFIKVLRKVGRYGWVRIHQSKTYSNWPHRDTLTINASIPENKWSSWKRTAFNRQQHGWSFLNDKFKVCWAPTCREEHLVGKFGKATRFDWALCGGFSLTALRRFRNHQDIRGINFSPKIKEELVAAQIQTLLDGGNWSRFVKWTMKPDQPHTVALHTIGHSTKEEWPKLMNAINRGAPIIMGMIFAGPSNVADEVSSNHQVLATGYRYNNGTKEVEIEVYDPNYYQTCLISMNIGIPRNEIMARESIRNKKFRGFFVSSIGSGPPAVKIETGTNVKQMPVQKRLPVRRRLPVQKRLPVKTK